MADYSILTVGTKILQKDIMDQYIRTLGDYKTYYAETIKWARRTFGEKTIHIIITELDLEDGSGFRLAQTLREEFELPDVYFIMAVEKMTDAVSQLAEEMEIHSLIVKPINATQLKVQIERFQKWKETVKEPWRILVREGQLAARAKRFTEAETKFQSAMTLGPTSAVPFCAAGVYYIGKPDLARAEKLLRQAIELKSDYVAAISALGIVFLMKRDLEPAEKLLKHAQKLSPLNPDRLLKLSRLFVDRAMEACKGSIQVDPGNPKAHVELGKLLAMQKDYILGVQEFEAYIPKLPEKDPMVKEAQVFLALARKLGGLVK